MSGIGLPGQLWFCLVAAACAVLFPINVAGQQDYPYSVERFSFLQTDKNELLFPGSDKVLNSLFAKMDQVLFKGKGQVQVVHIGGSHIQADMWSDRMRQRLQNFFPGTQGTRGLLFPYRMANTNNPYNFYPEFTGDWENCKNVQAGKDCELGLTGMSVTTRDSLTRIKISFRGEGYPQYSYNRLRVFHRSDSSSYSVRLANEGVMTQKREFPEQGYTEFLLDGYQTYVELEMRKTESWQTQFCLYGISLESSDPGFVYHSVGVNGASTRSYLGCRLFEQQLSVLKPDLVIFSIGINDANTDDFDSRVFEQNYDSLVARVKRAAPGAAILFTTNTDSYYQKRYPNKNAEKVRAAMLRLGKRHNAVVWDLYEVMGGLGSIREWIKAGLGNTDKVHLLKPGYELVADLMFNAFMQAYDRHLREAYRTEN